jgi:hypothetical protein
MKLLALALTLALSPLTLPAQQATATHTPLQSVQDAAPMPAKPPVPPSRFLTVVFQGHATVFTVEELLKLPQVTLHVHNAHRNKDEEYTGPLVSEVLAHAGLSPAHENEALILHSSVVATATDHYFVVYSAAELEPAFSSGQSIVAVMKSGLPDSEGGNIQLINTVDVKPARWIHGLTTLDVMTMSQNK